MIFIAFKAKMIKKNSISRAFANCATNEFETKRNIYSM